MGRRVRKQESKKLILSGDINLLSLQTTAHVVDPINPGAVDQIVHLGDYWNERGIRENKMAVIETNERIKSLFQYAYNYLAAAGKLYDSVASMYAGAVEQAEIYKLTAAIVGNELAHKELCLNPGTVKKYFASAITPMGMTNYIKSLIQGYKKVYIISSPVGLCAGSLLNIFSESAVYRGFDVELYYCPMKPGSKIEHLLVPEIGTAFISVNKYHDLEPWEIATDEEEKNNPEIVHIDMNDMLDRRKLEKLESLIQRSSNSMDKLLEDGIGCLKLAKQEHDYLESFYIPNMDFKKIDELRHEIIAKISEPEV
ncbi:hypothetical protein Ami103574_10650 [Aminipila butyrica]|uniref:Uncharacterized protein n=1 Tax=Aminipila butyrica TaxID=433296 RepID=A0A858BUP0_9FIRM|nr:hypothetical protein [Aminipila butyrica]QIB67796.1 hypothetical protein Ami103574_10650 [Aminipila butyrica]